MTRDDMNRWEAEIDSWRQRYAVLLKALVDQQSLMPPRMLADKESYEFGRLHGATAEREACAKVCDDLLANPHTGGGWSDAMIEAAAAIRARSNP